MKILTLIRHAKSSWKHPVTDIQRPLNKRGQRDAPVMGRRLAARESWADLIVSSPAVRAMATAEIIATQLEYPLAAIRVEKRIYEAGVTMLLSIIQQFDNECDRIMLVGHNPGLTNLVNALGRFQIDNVPTSGVVEMMFPAEGWQTVGNVRAVQVDFDYPKKRHD